jgi:hypothetical protein
MGQCSRAAASADQIKQKKLFFYCFANGRLLYLLRQETNMAKAKAIVREWARDPAKRQWALAEEVERRIRHVLINLRRLAHEAGYRVRLEKSRVSASQYLYIRNPRNGEQTIVGVSDHEATLSAWSSHWRLLVVHAKPTRRWLLDRDELAVSIRAVWRCVREELSE